MRDGAGSLSLQPNSEIEGFKRSDLRIPALCLMSTHVHLLVQIAEIPLSRLIQNVSFRYTATERAKSWHEDHLSVTDLCMRLGRDLGGRSQAVNGLRKRAVTNPGLVAELEKIREDLAQIPICQA